MSSTDRIEKEVFLRVPPERVWQALTDAGQFGEWFGVRLQNAFAPGARVRGAVTHPGYEHITFEIVIEEMQPGRRLVWRWHPYPNEPARDYSGEPMTTVAFDLEEVEGGTRLKVVESGFDAIPAARRLEAYRANEGGWTAQMGAIERYVGAG